MGSLIPSASTNSFRMEKQNKNNMFHFIRIRQIVYFYLWKAKRFNIECGIFAGFVSGQCAILAPLLDVVREWNDDGNSIE